MASLIQEWVEDRRLFFKQAFLILKVAEISGDYAELDHGEANRSRPPTR